MYRVVARPSRKVAAASRLALVAAAATGLAACAPTYGTGKRADAQLLEDIGNMMAVGPTNTEAIAYEPRPELVKPPTTAALPAPQAPVVEQAAGAWPESPEQRRARLREEATANQGNPLYRSPIVNTGMGQVNTRELTPQEQSEAFRRARAVQSGAYQGRRFLSDPPAEYKQPAETAAVGDLGEPEKVKERRRLREAKGGGAFSLRDLWPF